ncbi:MAG: thiamine biosynthesis protein ThiJ [Caulobacter sp. 12-67-6]|nr:MAG: thiamine biosynthesis protein ThiJ [Caulobacter sp. 12-67-6]OYX72185.1 MAG: thiamine biosynthesis protein ThiJ [Caulobacter sp. 32-67-35]OZA76210.1 MAG: thiamine biosynthesis protein ThiJ [Caulobacter sp. 39-67-4]HQR88005.1 DJ-1/PfpI family protein [Caulobacter sp.]
MAEPQPLNIVFALFPGVTHLDFTGPHQILCRLPGAKVTVASLEGGEIEADGLIFAHLPRLTDVEACDVLVVPGGFGTTEAMANPAFLDEIRRLAAGARYVTSVCTGSLVLGAAGLLKGKRAACHWAWRDQLSLFGAIPDPGRVARDGNVFTGGGVTAGIDFALTIAAEIAGEDVAQTIQLAVEYAPAPPFNAGRPETAPARVLERVQRLYGQGMPERLAAAEKAGALV